MKSLLSKEKIIELFFKYPVAYFSIFFLYATRSQFYVINNIQIYDSIIHNLLIFWGLIIILYYLTTNRNIFNNEKNFLFMWIASSVITIFVNIFQIRFDSIRSTILTTIVIIIFLNSYRILRGRYTDVIVFKYVFYPSIFLKFISSIISLGMYFYNISMFVISELSNPYTYGIRYVSLGNDTYNLLLYGTFFSPNKEVMQAIPLMLISMYILLNKNKVVNIFEKIISKNNSKSKIAFVGDGINDAPVLARADIGIAMGAMGSDAAIEAADIVIMNDEPSKIITAIKLARKTIKIANQNMLVAFGVKVLALILSALGIADMWMAVFADVGVTIIAVLNSFRALKIDK